MRERNSPSKSPRSTAFARYDRADLPLDTVALARLLIGSLLVREPRDEHEERVAVRIVETEAYLPDDAGSHAFRGRTVRNAAMFSERGHAYVYFIYGNHFCINVASEESGIGAAVLLRAAEPLEGIATLRARSGDAVAERDLVRGPGRLARALAIDRRFDDIDLCRDERLWLARRPEADSPPNIGRSTRIGLSKNVAAELRFFERGNPLVSGPKRLAAN